MRQAPGQQFEWLDRIFVLHALKVGLAGVLALFVAQALRLQYPEWSVFTVMTLNMAHYYPGSVALKALFHSLGTLVGASLGVWLVSDYLSAPVLFLSVTFVPVRIQVDSSATGRLRIGQTASVAISHGARRENTRVIQ